MRIGKFTEENDPIYLLDKNRGYCRIKTVSGQDLEVESLKFVNREAYDANYLQLKIGGKKYRVQKDELEMALKYV